MPTVMNMPKIGVNMTEAKIVEWVVKEGDIIKEGDHVLDAETDKALQEIYATMSGVIAKILTPAGTDVLCQTPIAILAEPGQKTDVNLFIKSLNITSDESRKEAEFEIRPAEEEIVSEKTTVVSSVTGRKKISPLARKIAENLGISVAALQPSKSGARIVKADVIAYSLIRTPVVPTEVTVTDDAGNLIVERMSESKETKPSFSLTLHANMRKLMDWKELMKKKGMSIGYDEMMVMIVAKALKEQPDINSRLNGSDIELLQPINIGIVVDTEKGLMAAVVRNADKKGLLEISEDFRKKLEAVKTGKADIDDLTGGTFTIANLGMFEIESFTPVIAPDNCCILALGSIVREPVVGENDIIEIKSRMQLTLVFEHRIIDGATAAKFLQRVKHLIEMPVELIC